MATCSIRADCRDDEGYHCTTAGDFGRPGDAEILGNPNQKFCAIGALVPTVVPTMSMPKPDDAGHEQDGAPPGPAS
jgi:hypothetical protein